MIKSLQLQRHATSAAVSLVSVLLVAASGSAVASAPASGSSWPSSFLSTSNLQVNDDARSRVALEAEIWDLEQRLFEKRSLLERLSIETAFPAAPAAGALAAPTVQVVPEKYPSRSDSATARVSSPAPAPAPAPSLDAEGTDGPSIFTPALLPDEQDDVVQVQLADATPWPGDDSELRLASDKPERGPPAPAQRYGYILSDDANREEQKLTEECKQVVKQSMDLWHRRHELSDEEAPSNADHSHDEYEIQNYSSKLASLALCIFAAVLLEKVQMSEFLRDIIMSRAKKSFAPYNSFAAVFLQLAVSFVMFLGWYLLISVCCYRYRRSKRDLHAGNLFVSHVAAFCAMNCFGYFQKNIVKKIVYANLGGMVTSVVVSLIYVCSPLILHWMFSLMENFTACCRRCVLQRSLRRQASERLNSVRVEDALSLTKVVAGGSAEDGEQRIEMCEIATHPRPNYTDADLNEGMQASATVGEQGGKMMAPWEHCTIEGEKDCKGLVVSFLIRQAALFFLTNRIPSLKGDNKNATLWQYLGFLGLIAISCWVIIQVEKARVEEELALENLDFCAAPSCTGPGHDHRDAEEDQDLAAERRKRLEARQQLHEAGSEERAAAASFTEASSVPHDAHHETDAHPHEHAGHEHAGHDHHDAQDHRDGHRQHGDHVHRDDHAEHEDHGHGHGAHAEEGFLESAMSHEQLVACMLIAWSLLELACWFVQAFSDNMCLWTLGAALVLTPLMLLVLIITDKVVDRRLLAERVGLCAINCAGFVIGFAWEVAFAVAIDTVAHEEAAYTIGVCLGLAMIIIPAWRFYIVPLAMQPVPPRDFS